MKFDWKPEYNIGAAVVDGQHQELFRQISVIGDLLAEGAVDEAALDQAVDQLTDYAKAHFEDEESLMLQRGVYLRHLQKQRMEHHSFMYDIGRIRGLSVDEDVSVRFERLLHFAANWLIFHTLQTDQQLGVQLRAMDAGKSNLEAYEEAETVSFGPAINRPVVDALVHLWTGAMETVHLLENRIDELDPARDSDSPEAARSGRRNQQGGY